RERRDGGDETATNDALETVAVAARDRAEDVALLVADQHEGDALLRGGDFLDGRVRDIEHRLLATCPFIRPVSFLAPRGREIVRPRQRHVAHFKCRTMPA